MEAAKKVTWTATALAMVADLHDYLESQAGDEVAVAYIEDLLEFGNALEYKSEHFSFCRNPRLQERAYRCAVFRKSYILISKTDAVQVNILGVLHISRGPTAFESLP